MMATSVLVGETKQRIDDYAGADHQTARDFLVEVPKSWNFGYASSSSFFADE